MKDLIYKVALCDDESFFLHKHAEIFRLCLLKLEITYELRIYQSINQLMDFIHKNTDFFHIIALDILMDEKNGIEAAKRIREMNSLVSLLFITSTKDYSYEGYSVEPIHYILKPLSEKVLTPIIKKDHEKRFAPHHIIIPSKEQNHILCIDDILYLEALNRVITVKTEKNTYQYTGSFSMVTSKLPKEQFIQCHKSFFVNIKKVKGINKNKLSGKIYLSSEQIPVGRAYFSTVYSQLTSYYIDSQK